MVRRWNLQSLVLRDRLVYLACQRRQQPLALMEELLQRELDLAGVPLSPPRCNRPATRPKQQGIEQRKTDILFFLRGKPPQTAKDVQKGLDLTAMKAVYILKLLVEDGSLRAVKQRNRIGRPSIIYSIAPAF